MCSAVDACLRASRLDDVPRFARCLAAASLQGKTAQSPDLQTLKAALSDDLPTPHLQDLQAGLHADRSPFVAGPPLKLRLDTDQPATQPQWEGSKPSELMAEHAAAAAPVVGAARRQDSAIKLLLLMQRDPTGAVRCTVVNGTGRPLTDKVKAALTAALTAQDPALRASQVEFVETSVKVASHTTPVILYSVLLRNLAGYHPLPEGDRLREALRRLDEYLAELDEQALEDLMACEAAWLHAGSASQAIELLPIRQPDAQEPHAASDRDALYRMLAEGTPPYL